ncbi:retrotransposon-related protein, partial [Tanacetum coccineum]
MHVFGKALNWHKHFMSKFREVVTWEVYQIQVKKRFESIFEDLVVELKNLKQTTNVQVYQDSFEELLNKVELTNDYAISLFIGGLKEEIGYDVRMFKPSNLSNVFSLAKLQEASNSVVKTRHLPLTTSSKNNVVTNFTRGGGNVTRNIVPAQNNTLVPNRHFKKLTQQELEDKRAKYLCFYYGQKYTPGHKCSGQLFSLKIVGEGIVMEEDDDLQLTEEEVMSTYTISLIDEPPLISLNALTYKNIYRTIR